MDFLLACIGLGFIVFATLGGMALCVWAMAKYEGENDDDES